jgi:hypothetical protein
MTDIQKLFPAAVKFLNIFQTVSINSVEYGKIHIKNITLNKKKLFFNSSFLSFKAVINPDTKNTYINFSYLKIPEYGAVFTDTLMNLYFNKNGIDIRAKGKYNNNSFGMKAVLTAQNTLNINILSPEIKYKNSFFKCDIKNLNLKINLNLNRLSLKTEGFSDKAKIYTKDVNLTAEKSSFKIKNGDIKIYSKQISIKQFKKLKNINADNVKLYYSPNNKFMTADIPEISLQYKQFVFRLADTKTVFKNLKNADLHTGKIIAEYVKNRLILTNGTLHIRNKNISYRIESGHFINNNASLTSSKITGNLNSITTSEIKGSIFSYNTEFKDIKAYIKNKSLYIKNAEINGIKINKITFIKNRLSFHSKALFNKNIKEILHRFLNTTIPVTQIAGENNITSTINFTKEISSLTHVKTKLSLLKLFDFDLFVPTGDINITNTRLNFYTQNAQLFLQKDMPLKFTGTGLINFNKEYLKMHGKVSFKINKIIKLKNYNETATVNFNTNALKTKNSSVYIDFNKKMLIINQLKKILKYTPFYPFVKNGLLLMTFSDTTDITTYLLLKLPVLYKHSDKPIENLSKNIINKLFLNISVGKKQIDIFNNNIDINVKNNNINVKISNLDINLYPLETLLFDNNTTDEYNYSIKLYAHNANLMYKQHKFLSQNATVTYKKGKINFHSVYKHSTVKGYTKQGYLLLEGNNFSNEEFRAFLPKFDFFSKINLDFVMVKSPDNFYTGKIFINSAIVKELKSLNNIIAFINTIPSLLSFSSPGFSSKGYKIRKGYINYLLYKKVLYIKDAKIYGDNLDFFAKGYIDFNKNYMFLKITSNMKMKLKKIPIIGKGLNYLLFGKNGSIDVKMIVKGNIDNPKVREDMGKDILISPFTLFKRAITLPFNLF